MVSPITGMFMRPLEQRRNAKKLAITTSNGIREERVVTLGGIEQWVTIRGQDRANPVIVILHGGPGSPYTPFNSWLGSWEQHFTVVQWDQPGAGKTFQRHGEAETGSLSFERLAANGIELVDYVQARLGVETVILLGSSVGSFIALHMIRKRPDLFTAYVGAEQNAPGGFRASYEQTLAVAERAGKRNAVAALHAMRPDPASWTYRQLLAMNKLSINLSRNAPHMVNDLMLPALLFAPDYTMNDIKAVQKGMEYSAVQLFDAMVNFDFDSVGYRFEMPFIVIQGEHDIITPATTAEAFVERITAPRKQFHTLPRATHLVEFCDPDAFLKILWGLGE
ncbi:alpha/beta hydrolase [Sinomonas notoginsengisoli]|uniref:alpha/beta fold hydrolase n=1 Tax=Sinomonas notoginsengisoli TaxID=1457311 RepID=UPI001F160DF0|nr:alpha/beta hydrolase [Sinomonas notoginsengisoli]